MSAVVLLRYVLDELSILTDEATVYLNRKTCELFTVTDEYAQLLEDEDDTKEIPEWQRELLPKVREILDSEDWLALPTKFDLHEYAIMEGFCKSIENQALREELQNAIRGRGAFRYFKDTIHRQGIVAEWHRYRDAAVVKIVIDWLEEYGIA